MKFSLKPALFLVFLLLVPVEESANAQFAPLRPFPCLSSLMPDSADENPAFFTDASTIQFSFSWFYNRRRTGIKVKKNRTFFHERYRIEPDRFPAPEQDDDLFPFSLLLSGRISNWFWSAEFQLSGVNIFKFSDYYYFINYETGTMDSIRLAVNHNIHFYRFRSALGRKLTERITAAFAPVIYFGEMRFHTEKEYRFYGASDRFADYEINLDGRYSGYATGIQCGLIYEGSHFNFRTFAEYASNFRLEGETELGDSRSTDRISMRMPLKINAGFDISRDESNIIQLSMEYGYWGGNLYKQLTPEIDLQPPVIEHTFKTGLGYIRTLRSSLIIAAGYEFIAYPDDSEEWRHFELSGHIHRTCIRTVLETSALTIKLGGSIYAEEGDGSPPTAYSVDFGISYDLSVE